jgi:hypothetical protein
MADDETDVATPQMLYSRVVQNRRRPPRPLPENRKTPRLAGFFYQAAEETRTLDLLHGKQTL